MQYIFLTSVRRLSILTVFFIILCLLRQNFWVGINYRLFVHVKWSRWFFFYSKGSVFKDSFVKVWLGSDNGIRLKLNNFVFFCKKYNYTVIVTRNNIVKIAEPWFSFCQKWDSSSLHFFSTNFKKGRSSQFARIFFMITKKITKILPNRNWSFTRGILFISLKIVK